MAKQYGDKTAEQQGRLTLNPMKHIDPLGTIIIPGLLLITFTGFIFGWAKPVPVDARNFKNPKKAMMVVALAGPLANLGMAIIWALLARFGVMLEIEFISMPLIYSGVAGITINLVLALINLLPIPPLDGSRILSGLLPDYWAWRYNQLERYGFIILIILLATNALGYLLAYPMYYAQQLFFSLAGM
jgi:Zn-dependent protease